MARPDAGDDDRTYGRRVFGIKAEKPRVRVVGGGIAGLEAAMALADLGEGRAELSLISPDPEFTYKPLVVEEPFTGQPAERHELEPVLADLGVDFISGALSRVDPTLNKLELADGSSLGYDAAIVCIGGRARPAYRVAETFWANRGDLPIDELIERADRSASRTLALIVPPGTSWSLPLYELALMTRRRAEEVGRYDLRLRLLTPEEGPLAIFGVPASGAVAELLRARKIDFVAGSLVDEDSEGLLCERPGGFPVEAGAVIALPSIEGPHVAGLPSDRHGFIPIDDHCRVDGIGGVYAAGDGTTFPVKQGGLATQQADCAAEQIAAGLGAAVVPSPYLPVLRGQLLTGMESLNMRHGLAGGDGEGVASLDYLWWPPQKVGGRYLSAWLSNVAPHQDLEPPFRPLEVEVSWPHEWHAGPLSYDAEPPPVP